ncbi:MAG: PEGA domain-containing protein [Polyangiales bacterium]
MSGASLIRVTLSVALSLAPLVARADDRPLWLREEGATRTPPSDVIVPPVIAPAAEPHAERARAAIARARELFLASAFSDAATSLHIAAGDHVEHLLRSDRALAIELLHWEGACAVLASDRDGARDAFRRALSIAADARLPDGVFPPEVDAFYDEVRRAMALAGPTVRTIRSTPSGARIEVDGHDEGVTPVTLRLSPGVHALRLERAGYRTWMGPLQTSGPSADALEIVLAEATGRDLRAQVSDPAGLRDVPDAATLARIEREYQVERVIVSLRNGTELVHPARAPFPWPWVIAGASVAAVGIGVGAYFLFRPPPVLRVISGSP